jgi:hypothetical protein
MTLAFQANGCSHSGIRFKIIAATKSRGHFFVLYPLSYVQHKTGWTVGLEPTTPSLQAM